MLVMVNDDSYANIDDDDEDNDDGKNYKTCFS